MDKTLALIVTAAVLLITTTSLIFLGFTHLNSLDENADQTRKTECNFQVRQYCQGKVKLDQVEDRCLSAIENVNCKINDDKVLAEYAERNIPALTE